MINCSIVDDQPLSRQLLAEYIRRHPDLQLAAECSNAMEAFDSIHTNPPDLIFLDIQMPSVTGISFIRSLKNPPAFVFVTAFPEHAVLSYELNAVDYLLKPVTYERFKRSIEKFLKVHTDPAPAPDYSYFKVDGRMVKLFHSKILYAQSIRDYIVLVTTDGKYITHMTMKYLAELLPVKYFKRIHRSFLVGTMHITSVGREELRLGDISIPVGESYRVGVGKMGKIN
jgi:two-component system LytT family response regulator